MHRIFVNACRILILSVGFLGAGGTLLNSAMAEVYRVDLSGTFTSSGGSIPPHTPFVGVFLVDTSAAAVQTESLPGLTVTGYQDAAVTALSITAGGVTFTKADIQDRLAVADHTPVAVYFSAPLTNGATPGILMLVEKQTATVGVGDSTCAGSCFFSNSLTFTDFFDGLLVSMGTVAAHVTLQFSGTPGAAKCHGQSVSALSREYGELSDAATALGYASVPALQSAIKSFCGN